MTKKYKIYVENGNIKYNYNLNSEKGGSSIKHLKGQLVYDMKNGIVVEIDGITLMPEAVMDNAEDIYNYFFNGNGDKIVSLTDFLCGKITAKRGTCDGCGWSSVIMHGKECRFHNDRLDGGLPISRDLMKMIDDIVKGISCGKY